MARSGTQRQFGLTIISQDRPGEHAVRSPARRDPRQSGRLGQPPGQVLAAWLDEPARPGQTDHPARRDPRQSGRLGQPPGQVLAAWLDEPARPGQTDRPARLDEPRGPAIRTARAGWTNPRGLMNGGTSPGGSAGPRGPADQGEPDGVGVGDVTVGVGEPLAVGVGVGEPALGVAVGDGLPDELLAGELDGVAGP
jgi:hypothetical protein